MKQGNRMIKKGVSILLVIVLMLTLVPMEGMMVQAADNVSYRKATVDGDNHVSFTDKTQSGCTEVTASNDAVTWNEGWYVVNNTVEIKGRIMVNGEVNLILCDGKTLTASAGITVNNGNTINIYAQSEGESMGKLVATGRGTYTDAGIGGEGVADGSTGAGGNGGVINIFGGDVSATGVKRGAGIGGAGGVGTNEDPTTTGPGGACSSVTIYGGKVTARGSDGAAGIGGGGGSSKGGNAGTVTIYGGDITAYGSTSLHVSGGGPGIGCGAGIYNSGDVGSVSIYGGSVTAIGAGQVTQRSVGIGGTFYDGDLDPEWMADYGMSPTEHGQLTLGTGMYLYGSDEEDDENLEWLTPIWEKTNDKWERFPYMVVNATEPEKPEYYAWNESAKKVKEVEGGLAAHYSLLNGSKTTWKDGSWYIVKKDISFIDYDEKPVRVNVEGTVNLLLMDGVTLTAGAGISMSEGATLNIYGQSEGTGKLIANGKDNAAGIGGEYGLPDENGQPTDIGTPGGNVFIHGGTVIATGKGGGAGIGGGDYGQGGKLTVYDGTVNATGGDQGGAGIGGGGIRKGGEFTIYGGNVTATGGSDAAGIGGGNLGAGGTVTVHGGTVRAIGIGSAAGIGASGREPDSAGSLTIDGGSVTAISGDQKIAAIGGGHLNRVGLTLGDGMHLFGGESETEQSYVKVKSNGEYQPFQYMTIDDRTVPSPVYYKEWDGYSVEPAEDTCDVYETVTGSTTTWNSGWYAVKENTTISSSVTVTGTVNLILLDGATLNASAGITVAEEGELNVYAGNGSKTIAGTGTLTAESISGAGELHIHGGNVTASSNSNDGISCDLMVYDGTVTATGGSGKSGIAGITTVYGGTVTATGGEGANGIGSGALTLALGVKLKTSADNTNWTEITDTGARARYMKLEYSETTPTEIAYRYCEKDNDVLTYKNGTCTGFTVVTSADTVWGTEGTETWYAVTKRLKIENRIIVKGTVNLILCDGTLLSTEKGITTTEAQLNIYGQTGDDGELVATGDAIESAAIGGIDKQNGGNVFIHGGKVTAKAKLQDDNYGRRYAGAGIGGGSRGDGVKTVIYGGTVNASGGYGAAGIGGGKRQCSENCDPYNPDFTGGAGGIVEIYGGVVTASGEIGIGGSTVDHDTFKDNGTLIIGDGCYLYGGSNLDSMTKVVKTGGDYERYEYMYVTNHDHNTTWSAEGAVITATCSKEKCHWPEKKAEWTLVAPEDLNYDGKPKEASVSPGGTYMFSPGEIEYYQGNTKLDGAPSNVGSYQARLSAGGATAVLDFSIQGGTPITFGKYVKTDNGTYDKQTTTISQYITVTSKSSQYEMKDGLPYVVKGEVTLSKGIMCSGNVKLVLCKGAKLIVNEPIICYEYVYGWGPNPFTLEIYAEEGATDAVMEVTNNSEPPLSGNIAIYGGNVKVNAQDQSIFLSEAYGVELDNTLTIGPNVKTESYEGKLSGGTEKPDGSIVYSRGILNNVRNNFSTKQGSIQKASVTTVPAGKTLVYKGSLQELVTAGVATGGTMYYALGTNATTAPTFDGTSEGTDKKWSTSIPSGKDAGTYYVWYKVKGDENHNDVDPTCVEAKINPVDKTDLTTAIAAAKDYYDTIKDNDDYKDVVGALKTAIENAEAVEGNNNVTSDAVATAVTTINTAKTTAEAGVKDVDDTKAADAVTEAINALPASDKVEASDEAAIKTARAAYTGLTEDQQKKISAEILKKLTDAETALDTINTNAAKEVTDAINKLPAADKVSAADEAAIKAAREAYDKLTDTQKKLVPVAKLTAAETALDTLNTNVAKEVTDAINALPASDKVTAADEAAIKAARAAYDKLTDTQKGLVSDETLAKLTVAETALNTVNTNAAKAVTDAINALPASDKVTVSDEAAIKAARAAYDKLTDTQKGLVSDETLAKLTAAETALDTLNTNVAKEVTDAINALPASDKVTAADEAAIKAAREAYDKLTDTQKKLVPVAKLTAAETALDTLNTNVAKEVTDAINALPASDKVTASDEAAIKAARAAYDKLTDTQKKLVPSETLAKLTAAEKALDTVNTNAAKEVTDAINKLPAADKVSAADEAAIKAARAAYDKLTDTQKKLVPSETLAKLTAAEKALDTVNTNAAKEVTDMINALPTSDKVATTDKAAIEAARKAYDALTPDQKKKVSDDTLKKLTDAETALAAAQKKDADDTSAADKAVNAIKALPEAGKVTTADKEAIEAARKAYDALTADQKKKVPADILKKLTDAETALKVAEQAAADAANKNNTDNLDALATQQKAIIDKIENLPAASNASSKTKIDEVIKNAKEAASKAATEEEAQKIYDDAVAAIGTIISDAEYDAARITYATPEKVKKNSGNINMKLKADQNGKKLKLKWGKVKKADGYLVYIQYTGKKFKKTADMTIKDSKKTKMNAVKVNGKKLKLKKNFKVIIKAYRNAGGRKLVIGKSISIRVAGTGSKQTNASAVKVTNRDTVSLKKGKTHKIKAKTIKADKTKKDFSSKHTQKFNYISSNKKVATVNDKGVVKAKKAGKATIYVITRNGYAKKVKVTVKK